MNWTTQLMAWYKINKRSFPWRQTTDPYRVWLSEVIMQQTRVAQGTPYYTSFIENFPTIDHLAAAKEQQVLKLWQGLGYYSRARNLHYTAKVIVSEYDSVFPKTFKELLTLKGIGDYTASAISSICFNEPQAVIDGNVYRVLSRYFGKDTPIDASHALKEFKILATELMGGESPGEFNQALMEFGALQCTPKNPVCNTCIFQNECTAFNQNLVGKLPLKKNKIKVTNRYFNYLVFETPNKKTILQQRTTKGIWQNLYEFPLVESLNVLSIDEIYEAPLISKYKKIKDTSVFKINETPIRHKLSHQQLYITFWKVKTNTLLEEGMFQNEVHNYPVPRVLEKFIKIFYL
ncbi:A/G-specific adenine glycosylase [Flavobacteriaceae bacterium]|nr:A/G-specific adenine glycosylase [Flavobacteriaceae bacterium]